MTYTDAFLLPLRKDKIDAYKEMSSKAGIVWMEYGALSYKEFVLDDDNTHEMISFSKSANVQEGETCIIAFITYKSREHRDEVNAKVMADERIKDSCTPETSPFDFKKMAFGGFSSIVDL